MRGKGPPPLRSSATTAAFSGASGSMAIAGFCWAPAPPIATCSVVSTPAPSAEADRSSVTAAPIKSKNT